jgi:Zn-dependent alcohol dehydrogenase
MRSVLPIVTGTLMQITAAIARAPHGALSIETVDVESPRADEG